MLNNVLIPAIALHIHHIDLNYPHQIDIKSSL